MMERWDRHRRWDSKVSN